QPCLHVLLVGCRHLDGVAFLGGVDGVRGDRFLGKPISGRILEAKVPRADGKAARTADRE
ncbi:hypothetical protein, partial [Enterobacter hormaechei]|uniref:hypothetical protein n=1 Tax=Enterobacter hormaechei TaxID=158836 RepID=UPI001953F92C